MDGHNLVAVYVSRRDAEPVRDRLIEFGISATDIRLSSADADASTASAHTGAASHQRHESFWDWVFGDVPDAAGITPTCAKAELRSPCLSAITPNASGWPTFWRSSIPFTWTMELRRVQRR